jgi:hypothetical protein
MLPGAMMAEGVCVSRTPSPIPVFAGRPLRPLPQGERAREASAARFGKTKPTLVLAIRVVPAEAGTHHHCRWLWVPALAALGRDDDGLARTKSQRAAVGNDRRPRSIVSGLLFTMNGATPTCRAAVPGEGRHALRGVGFTRSGSPTQSTTISQRRVSANGARQQDGCYFAQAPARTQSQSALAGPSLRHARDTKKVPGGFAPPGIVQLNSSREHQGTMSRWTRIRRP